MIKNQLHRLGVRTAAAPAAADAAADARVSFEEADRDQDCFHGVAPV